MLPTPSTPAQNRIDISLSAGTIATGGRAIGASIGAIIGGNTIIDVQSAVERPKDVTIQAYLQQISRDIAPPRGKNEKQQKLWQTPFRLRSKDEPPETGEVYTVVKHVFARQAAREHFILRMVILGEAGMGKTPALRHICMQQAKDSLELCARNAEPGRSEATVKRSTKKDIIIPFYINLAGLQTGVSLAVLARDAFNSKLDINQTIGGESPEPLIIDQIPYLLQEYTCLFVLDELEMLHTEQHLGAIQALSVFMEDNDRHQYVVSCREASYREQLGSLERLYLTDIDPLEAADLLGADAYQRLSQSIQRLVLNRQVLGRVLEADISQGILQSKGELLRTLNDAKLTNNPDLFDETFSRERAETVLENLALAMHLDRTYVYDNRKVMDFIVSYLTEWHDPPNWRGTLTKLQTAQALEPEGDHGWRFLDRTTQSYYVARAMAADPARLTPILRERSEYWWREMFEIVVGLLKDPSNVMFELIEHDALVAANSIQYAGDRVDSRVTDAVIDALLDRMTQESAPRRRFIVERISESKHPRALEALLLALYQEWSSIVAMSIVNGILQWTGTNQKPALHQIERDVLRTVPQKREPVADIIDLCRRSQQGKTARQRQRATQHLIEILVSPTYNRLARGVAAIGLGLIRSVDARSKLLDLLKEEDCDDFVAWCAVEALIRFKGDRAIEHVAADLFSSEQYRGRNWERHRGRAIYLLGWAGGEQTTPGLLRKALRDGNPFVRSHAVEAMARLDMRDARRELEGLLDRRNEEPFVLRKVAETLGQIGTVESIPKLQKHLLNRRLRTRKAVEKAIRDITERQGIM